MKEVIVSQLESSKAFRDTLCEVLNEISTGKQLEDPECLTVLSELIKASIGVDEGDYKFFYTILESSNNIFTIPSSNRKVYLWSLISEHQKWQDMNLWKTCMFEIVTMKIEEAKRRQILKMQSQQAELNIMAGAEEI